MQADSADLDDLDRLFDVVKREKGAADVLFASAGEGEQSRLGEITEQHFDATFGLNARSTLFTVQKALTLFNDGAHARVWVSELRDRKIRVNVLTPARWPWRRRRSCSTRRRRRSSSP